MNLSHYLLLASALFCVGVYGLLTRRQAVPVLLSVELMANASNLVMVSFGRYRGGALGQVMATVSLALTVAEVAVGLALVILFYRRFGDTRLDLAQELKR